MRAWLRGLEAAGAEVVVPAIADYEVRRELLRVGAVAKLRRLAVIRSRFDYLPVSEAAWDRAAGLWALLEKHGRPDGWTTGSRRRRDPGRAGRGGGPAGRLGHDRHDERAHLGRFPGIDARPWATIT